MPALHGMWEITHAGTPPRRLRPDETVADVEALVHGVIARVATTSDLSAADRDELFSHLLERTVVLTGSYDQGRDDPAQRAQLAFRPWLFHRLGLAAIDFLRQWLGRHGEKRVVDSRLGLRDVDDVDGDGAVGLDRLAGAAAESSGDRPEDWADALGWLYARGDRATLREERGLGLDEGAGAAGGDRGAAPGAGAPDAPRAAGHGGQASVECAGCGWRHYRTQAPNGRPGWRFPDRCLSCGRPLEVAA